MNIGSIQQKAAGAHLQVPLSQYATRRAGDWAERGFTETLVDFPTLNARSKFWGDDQRAAFKNWEEFDDIRNPPGERQPTNERQKLHDLLQRLDMKVMQENHLDLLVRLHTSLPPGQDRLRGTAAGRGRRGRRVGHGSERGATEVQIPAGYRPDRLRPGVALSADTTALRSGVTNNTPTRCPRPACPSRSCSGPIPEASLILLKVAAAYEAASKRRVPPPAFGPLPGEP